MFEKYGHIYRQIPTTELLTCINYLLCPVTCYVACYVICYVTCCVKGYVMLHDMI